MTSEVNEPTRRLRREGSLYFSTVVLTRNGAQNFHSFRTGRRHPRCSDRPMNKFQPRAVRPPDSHAKYIFEQGPALRLHSSDVVATTESLSSTDNPAGINGIRGGAVRHMIDLDRRQPISAGFTMNSHHIRTESP